jgi:hypothetical protein
MKVIDKRASAKTKEVGELDSKFYYIDPKNKTLKEIPFDQYEVCVHSNKKYNVGTILFDVEDEGESKFVFKGPGYQFDQVVEDLDINEDVTIISTFYIPTPEDFKIIK